VGTNINNIITILLNCMAKYGGVLNEEFGSNYVNRLVVIDILFPRTNCT